MPRTQPVDGDVGSVCTVNAVCRAVCNVKPCDGRRQCTGYHAHESISGLIEGTLCARFLLL